MAESPIKLEESVEITLPVSGKKVLVRGYTTGRIKQQISAVYLAGTTIQSGEDAQKSVTNGMVGQEATNKAIELIVISVDGRADDILNQVLDLQEDDYDFVVGEVNRVQAPLVKKTEPISTTASITPSTAE